MLFPMSHNGDCLRQTDGGALPQIGDPEVKIVHSGILSVIAIFRQPSRIDLELIHALPANSLFSVDTFTFSPSLMKRGTRISRPVSSRAVLVPPPDESPRTAGSV